MDESQLIIACKKQDRNAQRALYELYAPKMMTVCLRYCKNEETARDLLHDGFIQVFTHISSYAGKGSFQGWLRRIFVNVALENYRQEARRNKFMEEYEYEITDLEDDYQDNRFDIENISQETVMQMIQELPTGYRTIFNLFIFEEMPHKEIAKLLGINEAASRSQFYRAKTQLQKKISVLLERNKRQAQ
ncbi:MAG TPA: RNA polymerase [Porphyromonadaceae bacterium]|nr:RNA polymerase [Porphyromonadaceae bacterium]HBK33210.1 RNA polymerase [Porphyromonadaceae bacterium]HBL32505.1 RNA polymerase [Porphyromonadaceae bacterium]HBX21600.1 RNA polymerase [Porphyromonadaceae bacterium]HBX45998.1 RNA polymerase [Porphyromonadaceae bacterium]